MRTNIYIAKKWLFIIGPSITSRSHRHYPIEISISIGKPDRISHRGGFRGKVVNSNIDHELDGGKDLRVLMQFDPQSSQGIKLNYIYLLKEKIKDVESELIEKFSDRFINCWREKVSSDEAYELNTEFVNQLCGNLEFYYTQDKRIQFVSNYLAENPYEGLTAKSLSLQCGISESRLLHLFKEKMGITIRNYILWIRLVKGLQHISKGREMAEAASLAGFSDHPHFSRTFMKMFGHPPSTLLKNSRFIQK